jgi:hypothetical protein
MTKPLACAPWLNSIAHPIDDYPRAEQFLANLTVDLLDVEPKYAWRIVAAVMAGMARATVDGSMSHGDEHEYAALALEADRRADAAGKCFAQLTDNIRCQLRTDTSAGMLNSGHGGGQPIHRWADDRGRFVTWTED